MASDTRHDGISSERLGGTVTTQPEREKAEERFTDRLHRIAEANWDAQFHHPFVQGIGRGTLDEVALKYWVRQDYLFLIDYARVFAYGVARSTDLETMGRFANLAQATLQGEMELHRSYARDFGITAEELEAEAKAPACQAYADFLIRTAATGTFGEFAAAILPCMWGFSELGQRLAAQGLPADERYARWVTMYADPEFAELAVWCRALVDRTARGQQDAELRRMESAFLTSCQYEYRFWEMAWAGPQPTA